MLVLAIESSTSSAKAVLYDTEKGIINGKQKAYGASIDHLGQTDPVKVFELSMEMAREAAAGADVCAIALCGTWHGLCACDSNLNPVTPVFSWNFTGTADICREIRKDSELKEKIYRRTGCMPHSTYPRHMIQHLKSKGMDLRDKLFITQGAYNFYRLTGEYAESASTQSGTGIINLETKRYDPFILDFLGVKERQFARLVTYKEPAALSEEGARWLGLRSGIPVVPAHPDGALNQIGNYAFRPGNMTLSVGTSGALRVSSKKPVLPKGNELWCYLGVENWISGAAVAGACNCINWFTDDFLQKHFSYSQLEECTEEKSHVPVFLPFLFGERCPGWDDERRGGFLFIEPETSIQQFYLSLQMGILFNMFQCYEALVREDGVPNKIYVSGGITNSDRWLQMLADIFKKEILAAEYPNASSMGAVALAMYAGGVLTDLADFTEGAGDAKVFQPNESKFAWYEAEYTRYLEAYHKQEN